MFLPPTLRVGVPDTMMISTTGNGIGDGDGGGGDDDDGDSGDGDGGGDSGGDGDGCGDGGGNSDGDDIIWVCVVASCSVELKTLLIKLVISVRSVKKARDPS